MATAIRSSDARQRKPRADRHHPSAAKPMSLPELGGIMIRSAIAILSASVLPLASASAAETKTAIPRLESAAVGWSKIADDFQPAQSGPGPVTYAKDHPYVPNNGNGKQVTFRIADLTNPILKPWAIDKMREQNELAAAGKRAYEARASCRPGGVPGFLVMGRVNPLYFVQGKSEVLLINEGGPEVRHVFLDVPHSPHPRISAYGESVGHYEGGDTLVVDTIGLSDDTYIDNYRTPHTTQLHVVERFQLTEGGNTLQVAIHIEDPGAFNTPWSARQTYHRTRKGVMEETVCAENNIAFDASVSEIPKADKPDF
jgi:hypothetical protein